MIVVETAHVRSNCGNLEIGSCRNRRRRRAPSGVSEAFQIRHRSSLELHSFGCRADWRCPRLDGTLSYTYL